MTGARLNSASPAGVRDSGLGRPAGERLPQHMEALQAANRIRLDRAAFKRKLRGDGSLYSRLRVANALCATERPAWMETMSAFDLIVACPRLGRQFAVRVLRDAGIPEAKTIGSATFRQRQALAQILAERPDRELSQYDRMAFERTLRDG